jgi:hypothetical protein
MSIEWLLSRPVATLSAKATCAEAAQSMRRQNIGSIVTTIRAHRAPDPG